jgi:signal transduction histidine kinase
MENAHSVTDDSGQVAGGLVHKVRNSLNLMRAHLALLQKFTASCGEARVPHHLNRLEEAVGAMELTLREYLTYACPAKDDWGEIDLRALVREVLAFLALDLEQGQVTVREEYPPGPATVYADRGKLKRAVLNLIVNARQAMPDGGVLTLRLQEADRRVTLEVGDTGCGIPAEDRDRVFQPFFSGKPGGLGLGLALVRRTIEGCRGQVTFDSQVNAGTTFRVVLPTARRLRAALERQARRRQWLEPTT